MLSNLHCLFYKEDGLNWVFQIQGSFASNLVWHVTLQSVQNGEQMRGLWQWPRENGIWNKFWLFSINQSKVLFRLFRWSIIIFCPIVHHYKQRQLTTVHCDIIFKNGGPHSAIHLGNQLTKISLNVCRDDLFSFAEYWNKGYAKLHLD
jgi:hypothetical protein